MSWSYQRAGTPAALLEDIDKAVEMYGAGTQSRKEFEEAAVHIKGLIGMNTVAEPGRMVISVNAYGSQSIVGYGTPDEKVSSSQCTVELKQIPGVIGI